MIPVEDLLRLTVDEGASDLHISVGAPPTVRINGELRKLQSPALTAADTEQLATAITSEYNMGRLNENGSVDFALAYRGADRFRVSVYRQKGSLGIVLRSIPRKLMTLEEIGLPAAVRPLLEMPRGLILVTGPTGSGKTTTLASMLDVINETVPNHIMTIEDPIEYYHEHKRGIVNQREVGVDVPTFADGLRRALRQDPDVILVGEMRDLETMETAITASETGHLVFSTLHTTGAARTVDRIVDAFPTDQQEQIRIQLSSNLKAVLSQLLLPTKDRKGRVAAFELMINTPSIAALIRDNKTFRIGNDILTGSKYGMVSLEASLVDLYLRGLISHDEVMTKAQDPQAASQLMGEKQMKTAR
ncbi:MAG: type IV pilus twitching motility protein PilT [Verrucomicrobiota bacterium]|nr:type IV pilus twitching motility protein PilT [Verrucomicrobiota bacterium]